MWINSLKFVLFCLLCVGGYGALSVSYTTITGTSPCPNIAGIPACFIVLAGYSLMLIAVLFNRYDKTARWLFFVAWGPVFILAFVGTIFEISNGDTCPKNSSGLALCYISLVFALVVAFLYFIIQKAKGK